MDRASPPAAHTTIGRSAVLLLFNAQTSTVYAEMLPPKKQNKQLHLLKLIPAPNIGTLLWP